MASALDLIQRALRLCRIKAAGETPTAAEAQDALTALNGMLSTWRLNSLLVYAIDRQLLILVANQGSYTIGPGGNWNVTRPVRIEQAGFVVDNGLSTEMETALKVLTDEEYQAIWYKTRTSSWPAWLYYDRAYPLGHVIVYPVPTIARHVALYLWHVLAQVPTLTTVIDFPPGYEEALAFNLPLRMAPEYGVPVSEEVREIARETKALIELQNFQVPVAQFDQGLGGTEHQGTWPGIRGF